MTTQRQNVSRPPSGPALRPLLCLFGWLACGAMALGCDDLQDFRTGPQQVFRGQIVGSAAPSGTGDGGADERSGPFLLHGFASGTWMELSLDPEAIGRGDRHAGLLSTYTCSEPRLEVCPARLRDNGLMVDAELLTIAGLQEDVLSRYDFPGGSRVRNFILDAPFDSPAGERHATAFVSLMESGGIEVRVVAPAVVNAGATVAPSLFGLFRLERGSR